jgi:hypothetical protein
MAALGQDHGALQLAIAPVAPHKTVGHVPVDHVLPVFDGDDPAQPSGSKDVVQGRKKGGVAQHVADHQQATLLFGCLHQLDVAR